MKYNLKQQDRIKDMEVNLQGELQKSVWSIVRQEGKIRNKAITEKVGRSADQVRNVITRLIELKMVECKTRGVYEVSGYILTGES